MTRSTGQRRFHFKSVRLSDPAVKRLADWYPPNVAFFKAFRTWLQQGGYHGSSLQTYGAAARTAFGLLDKPYWVIDPVVDLDRVRAHLETRPLAPVTRRQYGNGLDKLTQYLRLKCHRPAAVKEVNWPYYLNSLPEWLAEAVRAYVRHCLRTRRPEQHYRATLEIVSHLTMVLRWMAQHAALDQPARITPAVWDGYLSARLTAGRSPVTVNNELGRLQSFLLFLEDEAQPICQRLLRVEPITQAQRVPRDLPIEQLRALLGAIETVAASPHALCRQMGTMDRAWFLLMLHSGLRTGEVRRLRLGDIDWANRRVRIEQSKGLKDRLVYLSGPTVAALKAYLAVRGPADALPDTVFIHRHLPLTERYCQIRLRRYSKTCGVMATPHQLRHSCATLLLNAGAPIITVQLLLGHQHIDTTLSYARLYDGTVAADYFQAMLQVESRLALPEDKAAPPLGPAELLALVDAISAGALSETQVEAMRILRSGLLDLAEREVSGIDEGVISAGGLRIREPVL